MSLSGSILRMAVVVIEKKIFWERARSSQPPVHLKIAEFLLFRNGVLLNFWILGFS